MTFVYIKSALPDKNSVWVATGLKIFKLAAEFLGEIK